MFDSILRRVLGRTVDPPGAASGGPRFDQLEDRVLLSLLGVGNELELPNVYYDVTGQLNYNAVADPGDALPAQRFDTEAVPLYFIDAAQWGIINQPSGVSLKINVDNSGNLLGGPADSADLIVEGVLDMWWDGTVDYEGVLLTGDIVEFGYLDSGVTDQYDFRFTPTGGELLSYFQGKDIGVVLNSPNSTFAGSFAEDFHGEAHGVIAPIAPLPPPEPGSLAGRVFVDANNNGVADEGEAGVEGVALTLGGIDYAGNPVELATVTGADGSYLFTDVLPGEYQLTEFQPAGLLDGSDDVGSLGGMLIGGTSEDPTDAVAEILVGSGQNGTGYNFGELEPSSLSGYTYEDFNNDALVDFNEYAIAGVTVTLNGTDDRGQAVSLTQQSDEDGMYYFGDLRPGNYTLSEVQPAGYEDGQDTIGVIDGVPVGDAGNDVFSNIDLAAGKDGMNYNFGERPAAGTEVTSGQTATIGFWQNKNGQKLIKSVDGQLGEWLAAMFPNMYGVDCGDHYLGEMTNEQVAGFYRDQLFKAKKQKGDQGPTKFDAQVMATAFAVYSTNSSLAGNAATAYGFLVTERGVGIALFNVGSGGAAFGVADGTEMTVMDILLATNEQSVEGRLYDLSTVLRSLANEVYSAINEAGDI